MIKANEQLFGVILLTMRRQQAIMPAAAINLNISLSLPIREKYFIDCDK